MPHAPVIPVPPTLIERVEVLPTASVPFIGRLALGQHSGRDVQPAVRWQRVDRHAAAVIDAVASSDIEGIRATVAQAWLAWADPAHPDVTDEGRAVIANAHAIIDGWTGRATYSDNRTAHDHLMREQGTEQHAGGYRHGLVRVGDHVAPAPRRVPELMEDLTSFVARTPATTTSAAVAHAHFETIHPYPDGNGRIGRALLVGHLKAPVSVTFARDRQAYYQALRDYRLGDAGPMVRLTERAAKDGASLMKELVAERRVLLRTGPGVQRGVLSRLATTPVCSRAQMRRAVPTDEAFDNLVAANVIGAVGPDRGERTAFAVLPLISAWASLAHVDIYGTMSQTRAERMRRV